MRNRARRWGVCALLLMPVSAWANLDGTVGLMPGSGFNLDNAVVGAAGADLLFNGTQLVPRGNAIAYALPAGASFGLLLYNDVKQYRSSMTNQPMSVAGGDVYAVFTNGGYYAKVEVTAVSSSSINLSFMTYLPHEGGLAPIVGAPLNNYSYIAAGLPNWAIAPGTLFIIKGEYMSGTTTPILQSSGGAGLPTTLDGTTVSVAAGGITMNCPLYYVSESQIAAVLPSSTPPGYASITVSYNGLSALGDVIYVYPSAPGFDTYYGTGTGLAAATDSAGSLLFYNNSASPGQTITLWGSGLGADTADGDTVFTSTPHSIDVPLTIYIGGIQAQVQYQGSSGYPGLNQINVTIPQSVQPGCGVSLVAVTGTMISNMVSIPVNPGGGTCSDPVIGGTANLPAESSYNFGTLSVAQTTTIRGTTAQATAAFVNLAGAQASNGGGVISLGNCSESQVVPGSNPTGVTTTYLGAGKISMTSAAGTVNLNTGGQYLANLSNSALTNGGSFAFEDTGAASPTPPVIIGPFAATVNYANPIAWTNLSALSSVNRSQDLTVTWTGGDPNSYVAITGTASPIGGGVSLPSAQFSCYAPVSAGIFTVPSYVLSPMPAGAGKLTVANVTTPATFTAAGLDYGSANATVSTIVNATYK